MAHAPSETAQSTFPDGREILGTSREGALRSDSLRAKLLSAGWPGSGIAGRSPRSRRSRLRPCEQVRLPVKRLTAKTLEGRSAPDTGELSQRRGRGAIAAGGQEGGCL